MANNGIHISDAIVPSLYCNTQHTQQVHKEKLDILNVHLCAILLGYSVNSMQFLHAVL